MKIKLPNESANCAAYGLQFDCHGIAEAEKEVVQSLLDAELVVEVKPENKAKK